MNIFKKRTSLVNSSKPRNSIQRALTVIPASQVNFANDNRNQIKSQANLTHKIFKDQSPLKKSDVKQRPSSHKRKSSSDKKMSQTVIGTPKNKEKTVNRFSKVANIFGMREKK